MAVPSLIIDPRSGMTARVTQFGQLVTSSLDYSIPVVNSLTVIDTPVNFIEPEANHQIVITDIILSTDRNIGANGAIVQLYCSDAPDSSTVNSSILNIEMLKNTSRDLIGLNFLIASGFWVNAITDDNNVQITVGYYRVPID